MRMLFALIAVLIPVTVYSQTNSPLLSWSARTGPPLTPLIGVGVAADGSVLVAGRSGSRSLNEGPPGREAQVYLGKLRPDGGGPACELTVGGDSGDHPLAMAAAADGSVLVAGTSDGPGFPYTPGTIANQLGVLRNFLVLADPCTGVRFATSLPPNFSPFALAMAADGSILVAGVGSEAESGLLLRIDGEGKRLLASAEWKGLPAAIATDSQGRVYVTGQRAKRAVVTRFSNDLRTVQTDVSFSSPTFSVGLSLAMTDEGYVYIGGAAVIGPVTPTREFTFWPAGENVLGTAVTLTRLRPDGAIDFDKTIEAATSETSSGTYLSGFGVVGAGTDQRIWLTTSGYLQMPGGLPVNDRFRVIGTKLKTFEMSGEPGREFLIPALGGSYRAAAIAKNGRIVVGGANQFFPTTPGSPDTGWIALAAFDLGSSDVPQVQADREYLEVPAFGLGDVAADPEKVLELHGPEGAAIVAAVLPDVFGGSPNANQSPVEFSAELSAATLPAVVRIKRIEGSFVSGGNFVVLAQGAPGVLTVPLKRISVPSPPFLRMTLPFRAANRTDPPVSIAAVLGLGYLNSPAPPPVHFTVSTDVPWLTLSIHEGMTPADITLTADPRQVGDGTHFARVNVEFDGFKQSFSVNFEVGAIFRVVSAGNQLDVAPGESLDWTATFTSTGAPISFTVENSSTWLRTSPSSGRTPAEFRLTGIPPGGAPGDRRVASVLVHTASTSYVVGVNYLITGRAYSVVPDSPGSRGAPGGLGTFGAAASRCQPTGPQSAPWPTTLGGCTLRLNGRDLPIGRITEGFTTSDYQGRQRYNDLIRMQLPTDIEPGKYEIELEDREGRKSAYPYEIVPVQPQLEGLAGALPDTRLSTRAGEEVTFRMSGLGILDGPAPWGDVPTTTLTSKVPMLAFVGGRAATVLGATLSLTEVGVVEVRVAIPQLAPNYFYPLNLRIAGVDYPSGVTILP